MRSVLILYLFGHCIVGPLSLWSLYCWSFISLVIVLLVLFLFGHCIVGPLSLWSLYCWSFISLDIVLFVIQSEASNYHFGVFELFLIAAKVSSYIFPLHLLYFACLSSELLVEYIIA